MTSSSNETLNTLPILSYLPLTQALADLVANTNPQESFDVIALMGAHGIGKSQWGKYLARSWDIPIIIETMSGKEPTDIIGNPYVDGKAQATVLAPPSWFDRMNTSINPEEPFSPQWLKKIRDILSQVPKERRPERILMMDEYNRVHPDTFGPMMNMVLTGEHHGKKMKSRTLIILAGNLNKNSGDSYNVNELDDAQSSRIREVEIQALFEEWEMVVEKDVHPGIVSFVKDNKDALNAFSKKGNLDLRTLTRLGKRLKNMQPQTIEKRGRILINLFVPTYQTSKLYQYVIAAAKQLSMNDIFTNYPSCQKKVQKMVLAKDVSLLRSLAAKLVSELEEKDSLSISAKEKTIISTNVFLFVKDLDKPSAYKSIRTFMEKAIDKGLIYEVMCLMAKDEYFRNLIKSVRKGRTS